MKKLTTEVAEYGLIPQRFISVKNNIPHCVLSGIALIGFNKKT